ncbi:MAG: PAS domain S-box protein [Leptospiraceae bacterium]|nr:PAS domain S-box protein [Leptospiraceae bacterium]MDW7976436.1 PAS domain S-box protein [Leptospiraceae bacterium]
MQLALDFIKEIFQLGPVVIFVWRNEEKWPVDFVTENVVDLTGYTSQEWLERKVLYSDVIHEEDLERFKEEIRMFSYEFKLKRWKHKTYRFKKKNQEIIWVDDHKICFYNQNHEPEIYVGYLIDVSCQFRLQERIKNELEKYISFFEKHSVHMLIVDPETSSIVEANTSAENFYGFTKERLKNKNLLDFFVIPKEELELKIHQAALNLLNYFLIPQRLADGSMKEVEIFSSVVEVQKKKYLFFIIHDITEKLKLQREREMEEIHQRLETFFTQEIHKRISLYKRFQLLYNQRLFGIGIIRNNRIIECNNYSEEILKAPIRKLRNLDFTDLLDFIDNGFKGFEANEEPRFWGVRLGNSPERFFYLFLYPINGTRNSKESLAIFYEVTDLIKVEKEKKEKEQMFLYQSKLAAIGESLNIIAHHWRQPLNNITLMLQYIMYHSKKEMHTGLDLQSILEATLQEIQLLSDTINDFKSLYEWDQEKTEFSVRNELFSVLEFLKVPLEISNIQFIINNDEDFMVFGYKNLYKQVMLHILNNSMEAILECRRKIQNHVGIIKIDIFSKTREIRIWDNGRGFPKEVLERLFQPYNTTKKLDGKGLGLYSSYLILKK